MPIVAQKLRVLQYGNMVTDKNKDLGATTGLDLTSGGAITYNHLNLPQTITVTGKGTITYTYDAAGNKIKKVTDEASSAANNYTNTITTTLYIGGSVYETKVVNSTASYTNKLQFAGQEEGRIRALYASATSATITGYAYDYMLKDHLGNVRMVLTDEVTTNYYPAATLEGTYDGSTNSMVNHERKYYNIDNSKIIGETSIASWGTETTGNTKLYYNHNDIPPASPNPNYPASVSPTPATGSTKLYKLNANNNKTGLEFVMKVMAGDKVDILGKSYYLNTTNVSNSNSTTMDLLGMFTSLLLAPVNGIGAKGITASQLQGWNSNLVPSSFFRGNNNETGTPVLKAYINYIFLDEQFKFVSGNSSRVGASGTVKNHWNDDAQLQNINVPKNGYLFVYVSNESNFDVFFDNLQVVHKPGPLTEETHYYPFGLTMSSISSKALTGISENKKKYQQYEFNNDFDINLYETFFRSHDPQLGKFWQLDPKPRDYESPYAAMGNNPILNFDLLGDTTYRFNMSDGSYIGMFDLEAAGQVGSYGTMKTIGKGKNKQEVWDGTRFEFADPENDAKQIRDGIINQLVFVSDAEIKDILTAQGAFNYDDKNGLWTFYGNSTGGKNFDYSYSVIPLKYGAKGASKDPLTKPSSLLFLPEGDYTAHNHMNFGNYLWAASGYTLGFNYATLQIGGHINSLKNSKQNGYPSQWDSKDDQNSIKLGAYHASEYKYRVILELRHKAELQKKKNSGN